MFTNKFQSYISDAGNCSIRQWRACVHRTRLFLRITFIIFIMVSGIIDIDILNRLIKWLKTNNKDEG